MSYYWGMHAYWWIWWGFIWIMFFGFFMPVRRTNYRLMRSPLQLLQARYAAGEITSEEYEERRRGSSAMPGFTERSARRFNEKLES